MQDTHKYLIHARITADGVVERSDVVGAVFGQTEGLLGDELDLRGLQDSSRIGRIDVEVDSEHGQSFGYITIASSLDKAETAILGAALEAITRVGPCEARVEIAEIEDMRAAKRREIVDRAKELLRESFDESVMDSTEILDEVREARRVEGVVDYEGLPAGPRVADSDAVIIVEGRSDVVTLLGYGIKNAIAVEGTNVPSVVADLTQDRTVTAFLDGDRGGELILRELAQVGEVDYVAAAPGGRSVEDLSRTDVMDALREKVSFDGMDSVSRLERGGPVDDDSPGEAESTLDDGPVESARSDTASDETTLGATGSVTESTRSESTDRAGSVGSADDPDAVTGTNENDGVGEAESSPDAVGDETTPGREANGTTGSDATAESDGGTAVGQLGSPGSGDATAGPDVNASAGPDDERVETDDERTEADDERTEADDERAEADDERGETDDERAEADDERTEADDERAEADDERAETDDERVETDDAFATLQSHVRAVIDAESRRARLLDRDLEVMRDVPVAEAFDAVSDADGEPFAVVVDDRLEQRLLDVAAQRGVEQIVARSEGEFVKRPASVRVVTADRLVSP